MIQTPPDPGSRPSTARRMYQSALWALPEDVRCAHGPEMLTAFDALVERAQARGGVPGAWLLALRAIADVLIQGLGERWLRMRSRGGVQSMVSDLLVDLKHTLRGLARTPAQATLLVLTLAVGIGATTSIFSVLQGVLFTGLPYDEPEELVFLQQRATLVEGQPLISFGGADLGDYQRGVPALELIAGMQALETNLNDDQGAARVTLGFTTPEFFSLLGVEAALGRVLRADDWAGAERARMEDPGFTPPILSVLLAHELWSSRFGSDPEIVGASIRVNGQTMSVLGVLPAGFRVLGPERAQIPRQIDAWALTPVPMTDMGRGNSGLSFLGRLAEGATIEQAQQQLDVVAAELRATFDVHARQGTEAVVTPLREEVVGPARGTLWILFGAVSLLLIISAINVASLLVVRATAREREFAVRAALGVSRNRVVRQLLAESLVLGALGALVGLGLTAASLGVLQRLGSATLPLVGTVSLNGKVLAFSVFLALVTTVAFGLAPVFSAMRINGSVLVSGRGGGSGARASARLRSLMIGGEIAISVVLVVSAGLLLRSFIQLRQVPIGFDAQGVVAVDAALPFFSYRADESRAGFFTQLAAQAAELPGVEAAGVTSSMPLTPGGGSGWRAPIGIRGGSLEAQDAPRAQLRALTPGALRALGASFHQGRDFEPADELAESGIVVVIDRRVAEAHFPEGAIGQTIRLSVLGYVGDDFETDATIVGVVEPVRFTSLTAPEDPTIFIPYRLFAPVDGTLLVRTDRPVEEIVPALREIVATLDGAVPVYSARSLETVLSTATATSRYAMTLVALFALTALLLAAVGLFGVVSTLLSQRTRELGVRMALGAGRSDVLRLVAGDGARVIVPGLAFGLLFAVLAGRAATSLLYNVSPLDPLTLVTTLLLLGGVSLIASIAPAARALRVDPVRALREE